MKFTYPGQRPKIRSLSYYGSWYVAKLNIEIAHEDSPTSIFSFVKGYVFRYLKLDLPVLKFG